MFEHSLELAPIGLTCDKKVQSFVAISEWMSHLQQADIIMLSQRSLIVSVKGGGGSTI